MDDAPNLSGKAAVVTGASRGIGLAVAEALVARGADVVACGRSAEALATAGERLTERAAGGSAGAAGGAGGRVETYLGDLRAEAHAEGAIAAAADRFGGLDILVNNAGVGHFQDFAEQPADAWREVLETNLHAVFLCCRAAIPHLRRRGGGWILNVSSLAGSHPFAGAAAYCASKAGLDAFTTALMQELRHDGIRVATVAPGSVGTEFGGGGRHAAAPWKLTPADVAQVVVDLLGHAARSLPSRVEIRPSQPRR